MKELFSNVCGKFILASVALAGVFTSCIKEDVETSFDMAPATATITVTVHEIGSGEDVTNDCTITSTIGVVNGNQITITGSKNIAATSVGITATWIDANGKEHAGTDIVDIPAIPAGGTGKFSSSIVLGEKIDPAYDYVLTYTTEHRGVRETTGHLAAATVVYAGSLWAVNNSIYLLHGVAEYKEKTGVAGTSTPVAGADAETTAFVNSFVDGCEGVTETDKSFDFTVSAMCYYDPYVTYLVSTTKYTIYRAPKTDLANKSEVGTAVTESWSTVYGYKEVPIPGHEYHHGHGKDGNNENAGGGIVIAD